MKITKIVGLLFSIIILLSCKGTVKGLGGTGKSEKAELSSISIGSYTLSATELEKACSDEGFSKTFTKDFPKSVSISLACKSQGQALFKQGAANITLGAQEQVIKIEVSETGKKSTIYTLKLKRVDENSLDPDAPKLLSISLNNQPLTAAEFEAAQSKDGFEKDYSFRSKRVTISFVPEAGVQADISPAAEIKPSITEQTVTITAKKEITTGGKTEWKTGHVYTLHFIRESDEPTLRSIRLNGVKLTADEFKQAISDKGCTKTLGKDVEQVKITVKGVMGAKGEFEPKDTIDLLEKPQTVRIVARKNGESGQLYQLILNKEHDPNAKYATLTGITIGEGASAYNLKANELEAAKTAAGWGKTFGSDFPSPAKISATASEADAQITWEPSTVNTTGLNLAKNRAEVKIKVSKKGFVTTKYLLYIGKAEESVDLRNLRIEGDGGKKYQLDADELKAAVKAQGTTIELAKTWADNVKVLFDKQKDTDIVTSIPQNLENIAVSATATDVKITVKSAKDASKTLTYTLKILRLTQDKHAELDKLEYKLDTGENYITDYDKMLYSCLQEAKGATGYVWGLSVSGTYLLRLYGKPGTTVAITEGAVQTGKGKNIQAKFKLPQDKTSQTKVVIKVTGREVIESTYTLKVKLD